MYAIIMTGGKQLRVEPGRYYKTEKISDKHIGDTVEFEQVLMTFDGENRQLGRPTLTNVKVTGEVIDEVKGDKIRIIKHKRRKHHQKRLGHRQQHSVVLIKDIVTA